MIGTDLFNRIKEKLPYLSKGQRAIALYIIEHYEKAAYMTASRLGAEVQVSESTVVRFSVEMGFSGYPELQEALRELIRTKLKSFERMEVANSLLGDGEIVDRVLLTDSENIKQTLEKIDREAFAEAVERILHAKNIYIMGFRSSSMLAGFLDHSFRMIFDNVKSIQTHSRSEMFEQIMHIDRDDVLIAISFPRYSQRVINGVSFAKGAGAEVIAITDSSQSPIAQLADKILLAKSDISSFVDSLVAPLSIINALVVAVAQKKQEELTERLKELESIWAKYDVYDTKQ